MTRFRDLVGIIAISSLTFGACAMEEPGADIAGSFPEVVEGWRAAGDRAYDDENLFEYIDGGAELYLSYGFKRLFGRSYSRANQPEIIADIFDMETSEQAFGVFSHSRETIDSTFGQGSQYTEGLLLFWKDRYFTSILASPETNESRKAVFEIAKAIESAIQDEGPLPGILSLLPPPSLVEESIRYFRHHVWLNSHYFIADENILHIDENTNAVLAKYGERERRHILLLVEYQTREDAELGLADFTTHYLPELSETSVVQIEDGTWTGCRLIGKLLATVFNASTKDAATNLLEAVQKKSSNL